jgi:hypothetical protein
MPEKFSNELEKVLARPDAEALARHLEAYFSAYKNLSAGVEASDEDVCGSEPIYRASLSDPNEAFAYAVLAMANYDDEPFLYYVAAGPLEDCLRRASADLVERVMAEARRTPRLRWMLNGVYPHAIRQDVAERINKELGGWGDEYPAPPRPWA